MAIYRGDMDMDDLNDMLMGEMTDDTLIGGMGNDELDGMGGDDRLIGGPGADVLIGGTNGMLGDTADYIRSDGGVYVDIGSIFNIDDDDKPPIHSGHAEGDTITEVENIFGSKFGDILRGNHQANRLFGYRGDDILAGREGNDYLRGESGADAVMGDAGSDMLFGDMGNDKVSGGSGHDMLWGGKGDDVLRGGTGSDVLEGGAGADLLDGGGYMVDDDGDPTETRLDEGNSADTAAYTLSDMPVTINMSYVGNPDPTKVEAAGGHAEGDTFMSIENVTGSMHDDMLAGDSGVNSIKGGMGDDTIKGTGSADPDAEDMGDRLSGGEGMDTLYGGAGNDTLDGGMGDDALKGDDGSDTLRGGPGADKLFGGRFDPETMMAGDDDVKTATVTFNENGRITAATGDTADYSMSEEGVMVSLTPDDHDDDRNTPDNIMGKGGDAEGDELQGIENLTGSDHKDMLGGDSGDNYLKGGAGNDWDEEAIRGREGGLFGEGGDDTIAGGSGNDWLNGGGDDDYLLGDSGHDMLLGGPGGGYTAAVAQVVDGDGNVTTPASPEMFAETLKGGSGNDTLKGGLSDADTPAPEVELLDGGTGNDTADYSDHGATNAVTITLDDDGNFNDDPDATGFDAALDRLISIENLTGGAGNDALTGNKFANILAGGAGEDTLMGGGGSDTFVFARETGAPATGTEDGIGDFSKADGDMIDLSAFGLSNAQLGTILSAATTGSPDANLVVYTLDLTPYGGRDIEVTMKERFAELDADDFMI